MGEMIRTCAFIALVALAGCQTPGGSFCAIAEAQRPSQATIDRMTDAEVEKALVALKKGEELCGWRP